MSNREKRFQKLTPKDNVENISEYEEALDFAINDKDIKNVALTGIYGAGKSSVFETYKNKKSNIQSISKDEFIHISLANYEDRDTYNTESVDENIDNKTLEGKILNQLLHQIEPKNIPQSIFKLKNNVTRRQIIVPTTLIMSFIVASILLFYFIQYSIMWYIVLIILLIISSLFIYQLVKLQVNKQILKSLSIRSKNIQSEIEVFKESDESYFDKYLDDVIYLFYNSKARAIVFEDIDRFDNSVIFAKLKEINTLVNYKKGKKMKK